MADAARSITITLTVNGRRFTVTAHPLKRLLDVLREEMGYTGAKEGCGEGECGACTVLMDGVPILSCLFPICQAEGRNFTTIEGLTRDGELHPLQEAFPEEGGTQCGACTPGMLMAAAHYYDQPEAAESLEEALAGNQCRCTGYRSILAAVTRALARARREPSR